MKYYTLLLLLFIVFSCKEKNSKIEKEQQEQTTNIKDIERKDVSITNEVFYFQFNKNENERKSADIFGNHVTDRFNNNKESLKLDGISDFVEVFNTPDLNPEKEITISIWYKPDSYKGVGQNAIVWKGSETTKAPYCQYFISATGNLYPKKPGSFKLGLSIDGKFSHLVTKERVWEPGNWYNLTGTFDGVKMKFYVNGNLVNQRNIKGKLDVYETSLLIGKTPYKEYYTSGEYDDLRIFNRALTQEEVSLLSTEK